MDAPASSAAPPQTTFAIAQGTSVCIGMRTGAQHAAVTSPAPLRSAACAARHAAPLMPSLPATSSTWPNVPLCASRARTGSIAAASAASSTSMPCAPSHSGRMPMSAIVRCPVSALPGKSRWPCLARWNVTVSVARTASPSAWPVAPSTPEGMSTAITGRPLPFIRCAADSAAPSIARDSPVPNSASTIAAQSSGISGASPYRIVMFAPQTFSRHAFAPASPFIFDGLLISHTSALPPRCIQMRAAAHPSPPLLPLPQMNSTRLPRPAYRSTASATACAACSISRMDG